MFSSPWGTSRLPATATGGEDEIKVPQSIETLSDDDASRAAEFGALANSV